MTDQAMTPGEGYLNDYIMRDYAVLAELEKEIDYKVKLLNQVQKDLAMSTMKLRFANQEKEFKGIKE